MKEADGDAGGPADGGAGGPADGGAENDVSRSVERRFSDETSTMHFLARAGQWDGEPSLTDRRGGVKCRCGRHFRD